MKVYVVMLEDLSEYAEPTKIKVFSTKEKAIECFNQRAIDEMQYADYDVDLSSYEDLQISDSFDYIKDNMLWILGYTNLRIKSEEVDSFVPYKDFNS